MGARVLRQVGFAAAAAALFVAVSFALALVATPATGPGARALAVGDAYPGGRIVALYWTGDGTRVVAVTRRGATVSASAVAPDGTRRSIAAPLIGDLAVYPSPVGPRVAIVRTRANLRARVAVLDVEGGHEQWWRWTHGPTQVRWQPDGASAVIAAADACRIVRGDDGQTIPRELPSASAAECP